MAKLEQHNGQEIFYTDGSKTENGVGYAVVAPSRTITRRMQDSVSVYQAELRALSAALDLATECSEGAVLATDSLSCLLALQNFENRDATICRMQRTLFDNDTSPGVVMSPATICNRLPFSP